MCRSLRPVRNVRLICVALALAVASDQRGDLAEELRAASWKANLQ
jgi:hypothetical protein